MALFSCFAVLKFKGANELRLDLDNQIATPAFSKMRLNLSAAAILATAFLQSDYAIAQSSAAYNCVIKNVYSSKDGRLSPQAMNGYPNKEFVVDRANGRLLGAFSSANWPTVKVLDPGSKQQAFKSIYVSGGYVQVRLLVVREFDESASKDFTVAENDDVITGICTHLN
ncbi:MAG: hypothetical protein H7312_10660 [Tardiphaga sp.]|nr:hypothetical protein [Tardiphaga sp.]